MPTCKDLIIERLRFSQKALAVHEFNIMGHSETAISARLREMSKEGLVIGVFRKNENYKEWFVPKIETSGQLRLI